MPDLLLELFSEEIPARMQAGAAKDLERLVVGALTDRGLLFDGIKAFAGPRRLTLAISGLPAKQGDVREELKGPKVDAPPAAIEGFLKKTGLSKDQLKVETTPKGDVYIGVIERKGRETRDVLPEVIRQAMWKLPWPKSMRWGPTFGFGEGAYGVTTPVKWVRPLRSILCTFDGEVLDFMTAGIRASNITHGHRFLSVGALTVRRFEDYEVSLKAARVILDAEDRKAIILDGVKSEAFVHGLEMIPDEGLLNEVAGLVEWPVVLTGTIPNEFMDVPAEILQTSMRTHQKYFSLSHPESGKLANRFALVANMIAEDAGKQIVAGNERVLRARLSDAKFFWDEDRKIKLADRVDALKGIFFHAKLGTQYERVKRIEVLSGYVAGKIDADVANAKRAAFLSKADLTTGVVGEFPELQGLMGDYYASHDGEVAEVAEAIQEHYMPKGVDDLVPASKISCAVAIADKIDSLVGFFAIDEKPTGSGDPYALRRAALGFVRIVLQYNFRINLADVIRQAFLALQSERLLLGRTEGSFSSIEDLTKSLVSFFAERLKVALKKMGARHDLIDAVFALGHEDDLVRLVARVEALQAFLKTDDGTNLLAGYKRAANILKAEEKKEGAPYIGEVVPDLLDAAAEKSLFAALSEAKAGIAPALEKEDFAAAMRQMAALRGPVDLFFDGVKVNDENPKLRENRLNLLASLRAALHQVADFSKIEG